MNTLPPPFLRSGSDQGKPWLLMSLLTLALGMLFAIALLLFRTPFLGEWISTEGAFQVFLVLHVDMSILVWYLSFSGFLVTLMVPGAGLRLGRLALCGCMLGCLLMLVSTFFGGGKACLNNYFPVIDSQLFLAGLVIFFSAVFLSFARLFRAVQFKDLFKHTPLAPFVLYCAGVVTVVALITIICTWLHLPQGVEGSLYYEYLFWGGGHLFQSVFTLLMVSAWIWLIGEMGGQGQSATGVKIAVLVTTLAAITTLLVVLNYDPDTAEYRQFYTNFMTYCSWLSVPFAAVAVARCLWQSHGSTRQLILRRSLLASLFLFAIGLVAGALIRGDTLMVPAHYHGTTGAINLAFIGVVYRLVALSGSSKSTGNRFSKRECWQPVIYGSGLFLLVSGLAWCGYLGIARKVAGAQQGLGSNWEIGGMLLAAVGGLIALFGIFLFLTNVLKRLLRSDPSKVDGSVSLSKEMGMQ